MVRLYANENFPLPVVEELRRLGHDVETVQETGKAEQSWPDDDVLAYSSNAQRIVLTINRKHFVRLHSNGISHAGIIACTFDADFRGQAARIDAVLKSHAHWNVRLERVNRPNP